MILEVISAKYIQNYQVYLEFNNGWETTVDLENTIFRDKRNIFRPLRDIDYFKNFSVNLNTICWENEADFAPEFLYELGRSQGVKQAS